MVNKVEEKICKYFGVDSERLLEKNKYRQECLARCYLWYILHYEYNWSINDIAKCYERNARTVKRRIARTKYVVTTQKLYKEHYEKIKLL